MNDKDKMQQRVTMRCSECSSFDRNCEEKCPYEIPEWKPKVSPKVTIRKAMKAEKSNEGRKAKIKLEASKSKLSGTKKYEDRYHTLQKKIYCATKEVEKASQRREMRVAKNLSVRK